MTTATPRLEGYLESFTAKFTGEARNQYPSWLRKLRENAFVRFSEVGFPTTHDEDWRFTNISAIAQTQFRFTEEIRVSPADLATYRIENAGCQLVFVNGHFVRELSHMEHLPAGVVVSGLKEEIARNAGAIEPHLGRYLNIHRDAFCALNTAFLEDGAYVHIRRGTVVERPIYLLFVSTDSPTPTMVHPRNLIVAEENSQATVIEDYVSLGAGAYSAAAFCNTATELIAADQSVIAHYRIERENTQSFNISTLRLQLGRGANVESHSLLLGGALVRNNVHPVLSGEGAECLINGLFVGSGRQHLDNYMLVEHASPHCASRQFYNGILDRQSHGVFHGRIIVHKDAQKTDAKQTNRNLLLSDEAQIDTKPQLEIYADDVKCTHGATIGQIEGDALFYLRSRGIGEAAARKLLLQAFAGECLDRMKAGPARSHVEQLIDGSLGQAAHALPAAPPEKPAARRWEEME